MASRGRDARSRGGPPKVIGDVLSSFLRKRGLLQAIEDRRLFRDWEELVGTALSREAKPFKVERGILWIGVNSAPQANHLLYLKPKILGRIRKRYPESKIREIRILHRPWREERTR